MLAALAAVAARVEEGAPAWQARRASWGPSARCSIRRTAGGKAQSTPWTASHIPSAQLMTAARGWVMDPSVLGNATSGTRMTCGYIPTDFKPPTTKKGVGPCVAPFI